MKNNKGFTLAELLVTIAILGTMSGIAVVYYNSYIPDMEKRILCDSAKLFTIGVKNCIRNIGGWTYDNRTPCKAITKEDLKKKFDYKCPDEAVCKGEAQGDYYCLKIKKDKYRIFVHFHTDKLDYQIHSGEKSAGVIDIECIKTPTTYSFDPDTKDFCPKE